MKANEPLKPDPQLLAAMAEIKAILKKYDAAALVLLGSATHMEYMWELDPTWSCIKTRVVPESNDLEIRVTANNELYPDAAQKKLAVERSVGLFIGFADALKDRVHDMETIVKALSAKLGDVLHWTRAIPPEGRS